MKVLCKRRLAWCLVLALISAAGGARAQEVTVSFPSRNVTVESAFRIIERQTGYLISYKNTNFDTNAKVQLTSRDITLPDALDQLLARSNRSYIFSGKSILIVPGKERKISMPVVIPEPSNEEIEEIITVPEQFFVQEETPPVLEDHGEKLPFDYPLLDRSAYYAQGHVSRGRGGRADYLDGMPTYALKVNLLYAGLAQAVNLGAEFGIAPKSTIDFGVGMNRWNLKGTDSDNKKLTHWLLSAEYRYWLCDRFNGHFLGAHAFFGYYNISQHNMPLLFEKNSDLYRYKGNAIGAGLSYGYQFMLGNKWNVELSAGVGFASMHYDKYECPRCGEIQEKGKNRTYFGPTRGGISIVYMIK